MLIIKILKILKQIKPDCMISLVADTIVSEEIISIFKKGVFLPMEECCLNIEVEIVVCGQY